MNITLGIIETTGAPQRDWNPELPAAIAMRPTSLPPVDVDCKRSELIANRGQWRSDGSVLELHTH